MTSLKCTGLAAHMLTFDEGYKHTPYRDSLGFWTVGVGHYIGPNLEGFKVSDRVIRTMLEEDIENAWADITRLFGDAVDTWGAPRQLAALNLSFNLGGQKLGQFKRTIVAIKRGDWEAAASNLEQSLWAKQVKRRATRVIYMVRTGELHEDYCFSG